MTTQTNIKQNRFLDLITDYQQIQILILGFFSGMPLFIIYSTLAAWMKDYGVSLAMITSVAIARIFYSLKLFWAPLIDSVYLPIIGKLGIRKSWMCFIGVVIAGIIFSYSYVNPKDSMSAVVALTIGLGIASATLDICIDGYRIDVIPKEKLSFAAANAVFGYRMGKIVAVAGSFWLADEYGWEIVFQILAGLYAIFVLFVLSLKEPQIEKNKLEFTSFESWKKTTTEPFLDFLKRDGALLILLAIVFYKLGDAMLGVVATPFYMDLGYTKTEIAAVSKVYGVFASIFGAYIGGAIIYRVGYFKGLLICGFAQSVTNFAFVWLNHQEHAVSALMVAITIENVASGMGDAALIGYISYLCNKQYGASQYAMFSSVSGLFSHSIVIFGGSIVESIGYDLYFTMTVFLAFPGLLIIYFIDKSFELKSGDEGAYERKKSSANWLALLFIVVAIAFATKQPREFLIKIITIVLGG